MIPKEQQGNFLGLMAVLAIVWLLTMYATRQALSNLLGTNGAIFVAGTFAAFDYAMLSRPTWTMYLLWLMSATGNSFILIIWALNLWFSPIPIITILSVLMIRILLFCFINRIVHPPKRQRRPLVLRRK